jgi:hypothetical protein
MKIVKTTGHDKKGKKVDIFYGTFKVKGTKVIETIITNNYRTEERAIKATVKKMKNYNNIIN